MFGRPSMWRSSPLAGDTLPRRSASIDPSARSRAPRGPAPVVLPASGTASWPLDVCETGRHRSRERVQRGRRARRGVRCDRRFGGVLARRFRGRLRHRCGLPTAWSSPHRCGQARPRVTDSKDWCLSPISPILRHRRRGGFLQVAEASGTLPAHDDRGVVLSTAAGASGVSVVSGGHLLSPDHASDRRPIWGSAGEPAEAETRRRRDPPVWASSRPGSTKQRWRRVTQTRQPCSSPPTPSRPLPPRRQRVRRNGRRCSAPAFATSRWRRRELDIADAVSAYPFDGTHSERRNWLGRALTLRDGDLPTASGIDQEAAFDRAASRRVLAASGPGLLRSCPCAPEGDCRRTALRLHRSAEPHCRHHLGRGIRDRHRRPPHAATRGERRPARTDLRSPTVRRGLPPPPSVSNHPSDPRRGGPPRCSVAETARGSPGFRADDRGTGRHFQPPRIGPQTTLSPRRR